MKSNNIEIMADIEEISRKSADLFLEIGNKAIVKNDRFTCALSGGSTPQKLYKLLAGDELRTRIDWTKVFFFLGDERDVSPASVKSNFKMVKEHLLQPLKIPARNIFRWHTEIINAIEVAEHYDRLIRKFFVISNGEFPRFDLTFLGVGEDGHTASLFPHTIALSESTKIAVANWVEKFDAYRLTLTFPVLNNSAAAVFLASGQDKAVAIQQILEGEYDLEKFPAQGIKLDSGKLTWLIDENAAELLSN